MDYETIIETDRIISTMEAVKARGIAVELVESKSEALKRVLEIVPDGASIVTAASVTLNEIRFMDELTSGKHNWRSLSSEIRAENDPDKRALLRRKSSLVDFSLGSVNAIAETGEIVVASGTGSQLFPYLSVMNVLWVAGVQKIVPSLDDAIRRVREYCAPKVEEMGRRTLGREGSGVIGKILIFENEATLLRRNVRLILVNESVGF